MANMKDIAERTNLSIGTVSRILNHDDSLVVSKEVRLSVLRASLELGYRTPRQKRSDTQAIRIAIADWHVVPSSERHSFDYSKLVPPANVEGSFQFFRLEKGSVCSADVVLAVGFFPPEELEELLLTSTNLIFLDSRKNDFDFDRVTVDFEPAINEALDYLESCGCKKVAFLTGEENEKNILIGRRRMQSMRTLLQERGLYNEDLFFQDRLDSSKGSSLMKKALESQPDAIVLGCQILEKSALEEFGKHESNIRLVLYRDIELEPLPSAYPVIRMSTEQLWETLLFLASSRIRKQGTVVKIFCQAAFER